MREERPGRNGTCRLHDNLSPAYTCESHMTIYWPCVLCFELHREYSTKPLPFCFHTTQQACPTPAA
jgi:hypothetical protein